MKFRRKKRWFKRCRLKMRSNLRSFRLKVKRKCRKFRRRIDSKLKTWKRRCKRLMTSILLRQNCSKRLKLKSFRQQKKKRREQKSKA